MFGLTKQEQYTIGVLVLLVAALVVGLTVASKPRTPVTIPLNTEPPTPVEQGKNAARAVLVVHVAGEVMAPGVYELPEGARVGDAVELAQPTSQADLNVLNLAARLIDGQKIVVPARGTVPGIVLTPSDPGSGNGGILDINSATQAELETLPGIGPARAKEIIAYREQHPFRRIEDIMEVPGIGPGTFERIQNRIRVN